MTDERLQPFIWFSLSTLQGVPHNMNAVVRRNECRLWSLKYLSTVIRKSNFRSKLLKLIITRQSWHFQNVVCFFVLSKSTVSRKSRSDCHLNFSDISGLIFREITVTTSTEYDNYFALYRFLLKDKCLFQHSLIKKFKSLHCESFTNLQNTCSLEKLHWWLSL